MTDLDSLIEELEKAEEGSLRELDYVIAYGPPGRHLSGREGAPHYTTSLDAALTLVPEGWAVDLKEATGPGRTDWSAHCLERTSPYKTRRASQRATPALALCIAALHARAAAKGSD